MLKVRELLTADDPATKLCSAGKAPRSLSARLVNDTRLGDPAVRKRLWDGGHEGGPGLQRPDDPVRAAHRSRRPRHPQAGGRARHRPDQAKPTEEIAKARFAAYGDSIYPDATFTLRLSYGKIAGWNERGRAVPPFTYLRRPLRAGHGQGSVRTRQPLGRGARTS